MWKKLTETISSVIGKPDTPQIAWGAGNLIRQMSEEEAKIRVSEKSEDKYKYMTPPPESIATIIFKYGNRDIYKDVYQFIQT